MVTLEEAKKYLRVDYPDEDGLIQGLVDASLKICMDVARTETEEELEAYQGAKPAVLYTIAYLFEHREDADHHALTLTLRSLLFGIRKEAF